MADNSFPEVKPTSPFIHPIEIQSPPPPPVAPRRILANPFFCLDCNSPDCDGEPHDHSCLPIIRRSKR